MPRRINPETYGRGGGAKSPVMLNIRLRKLTGAKPTRTEVLDVLSDVLQNHEVPEGWEFAFIEWKNPAKVGATFTQGSIEDVASFEALLQMVAADALPDFTRIGIVADPQK